MNERERESRALRLMGALNPVLANEIDATISDGDVELALEQSIRRGERGAQGRPRFERTRSILGGRRMMLGAAAGLACAGAVAAAIVLSDASSTGTSSAGTSSDHPTIAPAALRAAEANPRLLVTAPGWKVTRADEFDTDSGEMNFSNGSHELQITWYPARYYQRYLDDRANVSQPETSTLLGQTATTVDYGNDDYATMLSPEGDVFVEIRGSVGDRQAYDTLLQSVQRADVDAWLAAMPASVVQPSEHADVVDRMLKDVPLPPGLDLEALRTDTSVLDHYQLGAKLMSAVGCGWLESWLAATKAGDEATAREAVDAMATASDSAILNEMGTDGAYPQVFRQYAHEIQAGHLDTGSSGSETLENGTTYEFGPAYATALGCDTQYKRKVN
jgi:hypothetical protein